MVEEESLMTVEVLSSLQKIACAFEKHNFKFLA
jgi:hypothetical protein